MRSLRCPSSQLVGLQAPSFLPSSPLSDPMLVQHPSPSFPDPTFGGPPPSFPHMGDPSSGRAPLPPQQQSAGGLPFSIASILPLLFSSVTQQFFLLLLSFLSSLAKVVNVLSNATNLVFRSGPAARRLARQVRRYLRARLKALRRWWRRRRSAAALALQQGHHHHHHNHQQRQDQHGQQQGVSGGGDRPAGSSRRGTDDGLAPSPSGSASPGAAAATAGRKGRGTPVGGVVGVGGVGGGAPQSAGRHLSATKTRPRYRNTDAMEMRNFTLAGFFEE